MNYLGDGLWEYTVKESVQNDDDGDDDDDDDDA